jgi:hypothetical protein
MGQGGHEAVILRYAGLAAKAMNEENPEKLKELEDQKLELEQAMGLTPEEILSEAAKLLVRK